MIAEEKVHQIAEEWITAWNAHDLDRIPAHYADGRHRIRESLRGEAPQLW